MIKSKKCSIEGCNNPVWSKGFCKNHTKSKPIPKKSIILKDTPEIEERYKMGEFFDSLWSKLPKDKFCTACGKQIFGENLSIYWDHLVPWRLYPELKFEERDMFFCCGDCHTVKENGYPRPKHKKAIEKAKQELLK